MPNPNASELARAITERWRTSQVVDSARKPSADWPSVPTRFRLLEELGSGGMGSVYRALDRELGHEVALKTLHGVRGEDRVNLKREFRVLSHIVHPNLVCLHDLVVDGQHCFFTMELVTGSDFVASLRTLRGELDDADWLARLRDAARQLALALNALHEGGTLHRDVKPSNALITDAGRVVLLDFGLATAPTEPGATHARDFAGTVAYASPEQLWGEPVTRASDWYSFGASLYEAVSGQLPITGAAHEIAFAKRTRVPASLKELGYDPGPELETLILELLRSEPGDRPTVERVLTDLGGNLPARSMSVRPKSTRPSHLVGREPELRQLGGLFERADAGRAILLELAGTSGIGKSSLARHFCSELERDGRAFVLSSRCHPQEAVLFNAIDGLVDELARVFERKPELVAPLPLDAASALIRLFPSLASHLRFDASDGDAEHAVRSTVDTRRLAVLGLRALFERLAEKRALVLFIDDVQWADEDSGALLRELLKPPGYRLFTIVSCRSEDRSQSGCLRVLESSRRGALQVERHELGVGPLDAMQSLELVRSLAGAIDTNAEPLLSGFLEGSEGSPFLLQEVAMFLRDRERDALSPEVSLDELLRLRMSALPAPARQLLEVFAVAGAPIEQNVALLAAGLSTQERGNVADLERLSMLRTTDVLGRVSEIYHHRIGEELVRQLPAPAKIQRHREIANALLATSNPNPLLAVDHFEAGEDHESLRRYIVTAANHAYSLLAFERAARLYERAIALGVTDMLPHELRSRRAFALSNAGRGHDAGVAFQEAALALAQHPEADLEQGLELGKNAAENFIQSGHYTEGLAALREVLEALNVTLPKSRSRALLDATLLRVATALRGVREPVRRAEPPSARELLSFDTLWSTSVRVSMVDYTLSSYAVARCAAEAQRLGEPSRLACALALEGTNLATLPLPLFRRRADELLDAAERINRDGKSLYDRAFLQAARGVTACFRADFAASVGFLDQALSLLAESKEVRHFESALWDTWAMIGLAHRGEIAELRRRADRLRKLGDERGDRFVLQMTDLGRPVLALLADDRAEYALSQANQALSWAPSDYNTQHYWHFTTTIECELYRGNFEAAYRYAETAWPAQRKNHFLQVIFARDELWFSRARAMLGHASSLLEAAVPRTPGWRKGMELVEAVLDAARRIERFGLPAGQGWALLLEASARHLGGKDERSRELLDAAVRSFDATGMQLCREAARYARGALEPSKAEGDRRKRQAIDWMAAQGIRVPAAMVRLFAPGIPTAINP